MVGVLIVGEVSVVVVMVTPAIVPGLSGVAAIGAGSDHTCAALADGGMPQEEIDAAHESLTAGELPDIQPHPDEPRLTVVKPKPEESSSEET